MQILPTDERIRGLGSFCMTGPMTRTVSPVKYPHIAAATARELPLELVQPSPDARV
jgi:hypothetical protein